MNSEPVLSAQFVASAITAAVALLVAFGLHVSADQTAALVAVSAIVVHIISAYIARSKVTPVP